MDNINMNLTLLTFGERLENHYQACFAILTFLRDPQIEKVIVITDRPDFYRVFGDRIEFIEINQTTLQKWQGKYHFFWRVKIKALQTVQAQYPAQHLLYVDSDTFLATPLTEMQHQLNQGQTFMHLKEGILSEQSNRTWQKMHRTLVGKTFANIEIRPDSVMWNAGVVALPAEKAQAILALALQLCDEICGTDCERKLVEQFSFSVALNQHQPLQPCNTIIGHYWGNKTEWNNMIADFFVNAQLKNLSLQDCIALLAEKDWNELPLSKKQRNTNAKLKKFIDWIFPDKNIYYFKQKVR
ncbi:hypothetical protein [Lonepinella sp. MS14436]|uniref:hypothetical protein n=1 Tax=Lonepinella sp. MS14436 TaxID=3003619 RepID=UPI0036DD3A68